MDTKGHMTRPNQREFQKLNDQARGLGIRGNNSDGSRSPKNNDKQKDVKRVLQSPAINVANKQLPPDSSKDPDAPDLLQDGDLVKSRWRVIRKIGGGGFGEIYEAVDTLKPSRGARNNAEICSMCASSKGLENGTDRRPQRPASYTSNHLGVAEKSCICKKCGCEFYPSLQRYPSEDGLESVDSGHSSRNSDKQEQPSTVAIKVESNTQAKQMLRMEVAVLRRLQGRKDFCELIGCGKNTRINYIIMTLQGENLSELRKRAPSTTFSLSTSLRLVSKCLTSIEALHNAGFLHRDIKPSNYAMRLDNPSEVCVLDFGLVRQYTQNNSTTVPRQPRPQAGFRGTVRYASANAHLNRELGRHDDIWSLYYMLVEFLCGRLPWRRCRDKELVGKMKTKTDSEKLGVDAGLPASIAKAWIGQLKNLSYFAVPVYSEFHAVIADWLDSHNVRWSDPYDWQIAVKPKKCDIDAQHHFIPKFKKNINPNSRGSANEQGYIRRPIEKMIYGSAQDLTGAARRDHKNQTDAFKSTAAIAEDTQNNPNKTQAPGCITMASENHLHNDDDEASDKIAGPDVLNASHGDLRKIGEHAEPKQPNPINKQFQGLNNNPMAVKPPLRTEYAANAKKKNEIQRLLQNYANHDSGFGRYDDYGQQNTSFGAPAMHTPAQVSQQFRLGPNFTSSLLENNGYSNTNSNFQLPPPPPSFILRPNAAHLEKQSPQEVSGHHMSVMQAATISTHISMTNPLLPTPRRRNLHANENLVGIPGAPFQVSITTQNNNMQSLPLTRCRSMGNLREESQLWLPEHQSGHEFKANVDSNNNNNSNLPENNPLIAHTAMLPFGNVGQERILEPQNVRLDDNMPSWLPVIDASDRSGYYETGKDSLWSPSMPFSDRDGLISPGYVIRRPPFQQGAAIPNARQLYYRRTGMPKLFNKTSMQLLPDQTLSQQSK